VRKTKQSGKRSVTLNGLLSRIEKTINRGLQRGLSAELLSIGEGGRGSGSLAMGTGDIYKNLVNEIKSEFSGKIFQKGDAISIEAYGAEVDLL
jgi:hypothetical protein